VAVGINGRQAGGQYKYTAGHMLGRELLLLLVPAACYTRNTSYQRASADIVGEAKDDAYDSEKPTYAAFFDGVYRPLW
jgi:hypothetical protein